MALVRQPRRLSSKGRQFFGAPFFDRVGKRLGCVLARPGFLLMQNDLVHIAATNTDYRRPAGLTLERGEPESLLHARMNKKIGSAIIPRQIGRLGTITNPRDFFELGLQPAQL